MNIDIGKPALYLDIKFELGTIIKKYPSGSYEGSYDIKPKHEEQILKTKDKTMLDDLTVEEIPYNEVQNPQGGTTIFIE